MIIDRFYITLGNLPERARRVSSIGAQIVINALDSKIQRIVQSTTSKIEAFPQSCPRAMGVVTPIITSLYKFPALSQAVLASALGTTLIANVLLIKSVATTAPIIAITVPLFTIAAMICTLIFYYSVTESLRNNLLNKTINLTDLTAAFFDIDSISASKLNIWLNEQRSESNSYIDARRKLLRFFASDYKYNLDLSFCNVSSLPDIFDHPKFTVVSSINLAYNQLTDLPSSIRNLPSLRTLNLSNNSSLNHLSETILQLPSHCTVDINNCNFAETDLEVLRNTVNAADYNGPRISYSIRSENNRLSYDEHTHSLINAFDDLNHGNRFVRRAEGDVQNVLLRVNERMNRNIERSDRILENSQMITTPSFEQTSTTEQSLRMLYTITDIAHRQLPNVQNLPNLAQWLNKLFSTADFRGELRKIFAEKVVNYLERANEDASYREIFAATILDAVDTCGDKVALSLLKLGVTYQLSIVDSRDIRRLHHLLTKGVWALDLLHEIARQKISTLRFVDEIEVYLGYPIKLKKELDLPIEVDDMLFFRLSSITSEDLEIAKNCVLSTLANAEEHSDFLISQPQWVETLQINYERQYKIIEQKKENALDVDNPDYVEIDRIYKQDLKNITKEVIQSLNL